MSVEMKCRRIPVRVPNLPVSFPLLTKGCHNPFDLRSFINQTHIVMTTKEIAGRFYELAQKGEWQKIYDELYSNDAESIEPPAAQGLPSVKGMDQIHAKGKAWEATIETVHGGYTSEPQVANNFFSCTMGFDATFKGRGRMQMDEVALYEVKDGKIVKEQFFY